MIFATAVNYHQLEEEKCRGPVPFGRLTILHSSIKIVLTAFRAHDKMPFLRRKEKIHVNALVLLAIWLGQTMREQALHCI